MKSFWKVLKVALLCGGLAVVGVGGVRGLFTSVSEESEEFGFVEPDFADDQMNYLAQVKAAIASQKEIPNTPPDLTPLQSFDYELENNVIIKFKTKEDFILFFAIKQNAPEVAIKYWQDIIQCQSLQLGLEALTPLQFAAQEPDVTTKTLESILTTKPPTTEDLLSGINTTISHGHFGRFELLVNFLTDFQKETFLHFLIDQSSENKISEDKAAIIARWHLEQNGENKNLLLEQDKRGNNPLHKAIEMGNLQLIELFLSYGGKHTIQENSKKQKPLILAAYNLQQYFYKKARGLMSLTRGFFKPKPTQEYKQQIERYIKILQLFAKYDVGLANMPAEKSFIDENYEDSALYSINELRKIKPAKGKIAKPSIKQVPEFRLKLVLMQKNLADKRKKLLKQLTTDAIFKNDLHRESIEYPNLEELFQKAAYYGASKIMSNAINEFNKKENFKSALTAALPFAVKNKTKANPECLKLIIENIEQNGLNQKDKDGNTALHIATQNERIDLVRLLIEKDANYRATNKDNLTPAPLVAQAAFNYLEPQSPGIFKRIFGKKEKLPTKIEREMKMKKYQKILSEFISKYEEEAGTLPIDSHPFAQDNDPHQLATKLFKKLKKEENIKLFRTYITSRN